MNAQDFYNSIYRPLIDESGYHSLAWHEVTDSYLDFVKRLATTFDHAIEQAYLQGKECSS